MRLRFTSGNAIARVLNKPPANQKFCRSVEPSIAARVDGSQFVIDVVLPTETALSANGAVEDRSHLMSSFRLGNGLPDFGAAVGALIDEVDFRHAPMRLDVSDIHGQ